MSGIKVYCKDCKYYNSDPALIDCFHKYGTKNWHSKKAKVYSHVEARLHNENNDCKDYKRKWWKIWMI